LHQFQVGILGARLVGFVMAVFLVLFFRLGFCADMNALLEEYWKLAQSNYPYTATMIDGFIKQKDEAGRRALSSPQVKAAMEAQIKAVWMAEMKKQFTDKEIDLLIKVIKHPTTVKSTKFDAKFWNFAYISPILQKSVKAQPKR
jgi:hypothetical protein